MIVSFARCCRYCNNICIETNPSEPVLRRLPTEEELRKRYLVPGSQVSTSRMKHRYKSRSRSRYDSLTLGDIRLQSGERLTAARLTFLTVGSLNAARDNAVVLPTYYTGHHSSY